MFEFSKFRKIFEFYESNFESENQFELNIPSINLTSYEYMTNMASLATVI